MYDVMGDGNREINIYIKENFMPRIARKYLETSFAYFFIHGNLLGTLPCIEFYWHNDERI